MQDSYVPSRVNSIHDVKMVASSGAQSAVIATDRFRCFTFGFSLEANQSIPALLEDTKGTPVENVVQVEVGGSHGALVNLNGEVYTWGKGRSSWFSTRRMSTFGGWHVPSKTL